MIASLSQLLRESLDVGTVDRVPLARELDLLERYVDIQRARFGDRLDVGIEVEADARDALVPPLILQPLVENSIRHGLAARVTAGRIRVRAMRQGDRLVLEVQDDGAGLEPDVGTREGVGLGNTRARLQQLYGQAHSVEIGNAEGGGALVRLTMPWSATRPRQGRHEPASAHRGRRAGRAPAASPAPSRRAGRRGRRRVRRRPERGDRRPRARTGRRAARRADAGDGWIRGHRRARRRGPGPPAASGHHLRDGAQPYALRAFEVHALDYLLKPVTGERLAGAIDPRARASPSAGGPPSIRASWRCSPTSLRAAAS